MNEGLILNILSRFQVFLYCQAQYQLQLSSMFLIFCQYKARLVADLAELLLVTTTLCYSILATYFLLLATCYLLLDIFYLLHAIYYLQLATCYLPLATCYLLLAICYLLCATCCFLYAKYAILLLATCYLLRLDTCFYLFFVTCYYYPLLLNTCFAITGNYQYW